DSSPGMGRSFYKEQNKTVWLARDLRATKVTAKNHATNHRKVGGGPPFPYSPPRIAAVFLFSAILDGARSAATTPGSWNMPIAKELIVSDADKMVRRLARNGHTAYRVGGCVRDLLLGRTPKDFDVATSATPPEIKDLFRNCRIIGRRFRLAHIFFGAKIIETSTFRMNPPQPMSLDDLHDLLTRPHNALRS